MKNLPRPVISVTMMLASLTNVHAEDIFIDVTAPSRMHVHQTINLESMDGARLRSFIEGLSKGCDSMDSDGVRLVAEGFLSLTGTEVATAARQR